jgi:AcrR family transcriptional regulator
MAARAASRDISTRHRILEAGRLRFNADGLQAAALYRVAGDLRISPGNLTYHFKNKAELAIALADQLEHEMETATRPFAEPPDSQRVIALMESVITLLWRYRFLFNSSHYLAGVDERLAVRYQALHLKIRALIRDYTEAMIANGAMRSPRPDGARIIADNVLAVWVSWLQLQGLSDDAAGDTPTLPMLRDCLEHHFGLLEPYLSKAFVTEIDLALAKRYSAA